ncbi:hypothetical protein J6590_057094 [Homalodisca vitripennis]|nr:hypothetical protein J6590_057094 [Homalodisca vitripennis]
MYLKEYWCNKSENESKAQSHKGAKSEDRTWKAGQRTGLRPKSGASKGSSSNSTPIISILPSPVLKSLQPYCYRTLGELSEFTKPTSGVRPVTFLSRSLSSL